MILFRSIIYFVLMTISTLLFATCLVTIGMLMSFPSRSKIANAWGMLNLWYLDKICHLKYKVSGWENLPGGSAIVMAKHQSTWETMALRGIFPPEQAWIMKRELTWVPIFGLAVIAVQSITINRSSGRTAMQQIITDGTDKLNKGRLVMIFPEGTRVAPGEHKRYGLGGAILSEQSGYPIIPVAHNAGVFWRRRGVRKLPGTIQMVIGEPIDPRGKTANEIIAEVEEWIETTVAGLPQEMDRTG